MRKPVLLGPEVYWVGALGEFFRFIAAKRYALAHRSGEPLGRYDFQLARALAESSNRAARDGKRAEHRVQRRPRNFLEIIRRADLRAQIGDRAQVMQNLPHHKAHHFLLIWVQ
jgi:hypothetical protein